MLRVLVTVSPRMYREAIALAVHRRRPGFDVRIAPPEAALGELAGFRPHLLVHNDTAPLPAAALAEIPYRVEVLYSDSMSVKTNVDGRTGEIQDMDVEGLLAVVDEAASFLEEAASAGG